MASAAAKVETRTWVLQAETELRFDVSAEHTLTVVVSLRRPWVDFGDRDIQIQQ